MDEMEEICLWMLSLGVLRVTVAWISLRVILRNK